MSGFSSLYIYYWLSWSFLWATFLSIFQSEPKLHAAPEEKVLKESQVNICLLCMNILRARTRKIIHRKFIEKLCSSESNLINEMWPVWPLHKYTTSSLLIHLLLNKRLGSSHKYLEECWPHWLHVWPSISFTPQQWLPSRLWVPGPLEVSVGPDGKVEGVFWPSLKWCTGGTSLDN